MSEPESSAKRDSTGREGLLGTALRGAAGGAVVGAGLGASLAIVNALRPEQVQSAKKVVTEAGREVGGAAARAARDVVTSRPVSDLFLAAKEQDGNRSEAMKQAAKEAAVAAAVAARETIATMREQRGTTKESS